MSTTEEIRERAQQTFRDHLAHLSSGQIDRWLALFAEDGVLEFPYAPDGYPTTFDKSGLAEYMPNFPEQFDLEFTDVQFIETVDPSVVVARLRSEGTARATGNRYDQHYISVVQTRDGLITHYLDYWNPLVMMKALGSGAGDTYGSFVS